MSDMFTRSPGDPARLSEMTSWKDMELPGTRTDVVTDGTHKMKRKSFTIATLLLASSTVDAFATTPIVYLHRPRVGLRVQMIDAPSGPSLEYLIGKVSSFFAGSNTKPVSACDAI